MEVSILSRRKEIPYDDLLRQYFSTEPSDVYGLGNWSVIYYTNWALRKVFGNYRFTGIPDGWDHEYMLEHLFIDGMIGITDTKLGVLPLKCGRTGVNVFDHPTGLIFANPVLGSFERRIEDSIGSISIATGDNRKPAALVKLQYNYMGIMPTVNRYAVLLAMCDAATAVNLINTKTAAVFAASNQKEAASYKRMFDQIQQGRPAVFIGDDLASKIRDRIFFQNVKEVFVAGDIEQVKRQIINDFLSDIGINNSNTEKRERLVTNEVSSNIQEIKAGAEHWIRTVNEGLEVANALYGLSLGFERLPIEAPKEGEEETPDDSTESA